MNKTLSAALCAAFLAGTVGIQAFARQAAPVAQTVDEALKTDKIKSVIRREPRAQDAIAKVEANIAKLKADPNTKVYGDRLEGTLFEVEMFGPGETEMRLKDDVDLLVAAGGTLKPPTADEIKPLQERYAKLVSSIDDQALVKDFDRVLKRHDKFIRYTSLGLWDKDKIASELQSLEDSVSSAPDIAFGRAETLRGLQDRKLQGVSKLVYLGTDPHEDVMLSPARRSIGIVEEALGGAVQAETAELVVQNPDGTMVDLSTTNNPANGMPFSPPLSLWMKTRMAEGRVPTIIFALPPTMTAQDVLDGKLDAYFKKNIGDIASTKEAALVGLFDDFDQDIAVNSFGADGRTPFYMLDPKMSGMSREQAAAEYIKKAQKGTYANPKSVTADLSSQYGDKAIPDGPERVRDAWKHIREVVGTTGPNLSYFSVAGAFHGSKYPFKAVGLESAGNQAWNKLEYYWPGEGVLDWLGIHAVGSDPNVEPKGPNLTEAIDPFFYEVRSSAWQNTPVILAGLAPGTVTNPNAEAGWILLVFQRIIPATYPNINMVFVDLPQRLTLWSRDASAAYRTNVTSNKAYKTLLRFKILNAAK
jgi:hypothetical protein